MKRKKEIKGKFSCLITILFLLVLPSLITGYTCGCGGSDTAPISIPAPTGGYITVTAPDSEGQILVYGYIYADNSPVANAAVTVTNDSVNANSNKGAYKTVSVSTTTDATGYFSTSIAGATGNTINVTYTDPTTGQQSDATSFTVGNTSQQMSSADMIPGDVALGLNGIAYVAANDGTNSEIIEINLTTGEIANRYTFTNKLFSRIATHRGLGYIAVLDTTNDTLYWYDGTNLSDDVAESDSKVFTTQTYDVATVDLSESPVTTNEMLIVSHDITVDFGIVTIYALSTATPGTLGASTTNNCLAYPTDPLYPGCSAANDPPPLRATRLDLVKTSTNWAHLAMIVEYNDSDTTVRASHLLFLQGSVTVGFNYTVGGYGSYDLGTNVPYTIKWADEDIALLSDITNGSVVRLAIDDDANITATNLAVGANPADVCTNDDNTISYVAIQGDSEIQGIDMNTFQTNDSAYGAAFNPTEMVCYDDGGTTQRVGVITTTPAPLFNTIDVSQ